MLLNRLYFAAFIMFFAVLGATFVWATCHDDTACEDIEDDLLLGKSWDQPLDNQVYYWINNWSTIEDLPSLTVDVDYAASYWHRIEIDGQIVAFGLVKAGHSAIYEPWDEDQKNVVGWGNLPWNEHQKITARIVWWDNDDDSSELIETGTIFNYYTPFDVHGSTDDDEYCLRNTATHEFGHWIMLNDLKPDDDGDYCDDYDHYTMWQPGAPNNHDKETLACEDKRAALEVYGTSGND